MTGSAKGTGFAIACMPAGSGTEEIDGITDEAARQHTRSVIYGDTVNPADEVAMTIERAHVPCGGRDIVVSGAAIRHVRSVGERPVEGCNSIPAIGLPGAFRAGQAALRHMTRSARILPILSAHASAASPCKAAQVAAGPGRSQAALMREADLAAPPTSRFADVAELAGFSAFLRCNAAVSITGTPPVDGPCITQRRTFVSCAKTTC